MAADLVSYLNKNDNGPFFSKLQQMLAALPQPRATVAQWLNMIQNFTQKGVKKMEIDETEIMTWLASQDPAAVLEKNSWVSKGATKESPAPVLEKSTLLRQLSSTGATIKEVILGLPQYEIHRQPGGVYRETLYILNSEKDNVIDELETIEYEMAELAFHIERVMENPDLLTDLETRRTELIDYQPKAHDFVAPHFTKTVQSKHGRNLMAHARTVEFEDTFLIQEIQSDWAQKGRRVDWSGIPKGPFVTNTEAWAGAVLRRELQRAALNPKIKRICWITETMRNGQVQNLTAERADAERLAKRADMIKDVSTKFVDDLKTEGMTDEQLRILKDAGAAQGAMAANRAGYHDGDGMNAFYLRMIPKLAEKAMAGTDGKVVLSTTIDFKNGRAPVVVPSIEITDSVRAKLIAAQPLYSRAPTTGVPRSETDPGLADLIRNCAMMTGSPKHLRLVKTVYDTATGKRVAGAYANKIVHVALDARDIEEAIDHEAFHFAEDNLLSRAEVRMLHEQFAPGGVLNDRVQEILIQRHDLALAHHCRNPQEAAAQGFALWKKGLLDVAPEPVTGVFSDIVNSFRDVCSWLRVKVLDQKLQTVEDVFTAFKTGALVDREVERVRDRDRAGVHY